MKAKDIQRYQQTAKVAWEAIQGWLWLALMWLSIAVNFSHIEAILADWSGVSDWTTYLGALIVEAISGLSFSNALTNLGTMLASTGKNATKEKKRRAAAYFILSLAAGLVAVSFSGWVNILWYNGAVIAGIVSPIATVICAVMEASRRYEVRMQQVKVQADTDAQKDKVAAQKVLQSLNPAQRRKQVVVVLRKGAQTTEQLATVFNVHRTTLHRDLKQLAQQGKVKPNGGSEWVAA